MQETKPSGLLSIDEATQAVIDYDHKDSTLKVGDFGISYVDQGEDDPIYMANIDGQEAELSPSAAHDFLGAIKVPKQIVTDLKSNPSLLSNVISHQKAKRSSDDLRLIYTKGKISHIERGGNSGICLTDAWNVIRELEGVEGVSEISEYKGKFYVRVVTGFNSNPPKKVGDVSKAGISVTLNGQTIVKPFVHRLVCLNGMQSSTELNMSEMESDGTLQDRFKQMCDYSLTVSRQVLSRFVNSDEQVVENPVTFLASLLKEHGVPGSAREDLVTRIEKEAPNSTVYELVNIVTSYARELPQKKRDKLEVVGSMVLDAYDGKKKCKSCNNPLYVSEN